MITYLASPYSHPDPAVREWRFQAACDYAGRLMLAGQVVFSPIAHSHPIAHHLPAERVLDLEFWLAQDLPILERCSKIVVLALDGWMDSRGVKREIQHAHTHEIPIEFHTMNGRCRDSA